MIASARPLQADSAGGRIGIDRVNAVLYGLVVCQAMNFRTGRGRFNVADSLAATMRIMRNNVDGMPSYFTHQVAGGPNNLGNFLGRFRSPRIDCDLVRADLFLDHTALDPSPTGGPQPLGVYILNLALSDPDVLACSLTLTADKLVERDGRGRPLTGPDGKPLASLWIPTAINSIDLVTQGDATTSLLAYPATLEVLRARNNFRKLKAQLESGSGRTRNDHSAFADTDDMELLRARWRHMKRKACI